MYRFLLEFLDLPYKFFKQFTAGQYAKATWAVLIWVGTVAFCLISLSTMCERVIQM